ncbi:hypothetical protein ACQPWY_13720 [Pseudonocardia xinjiangensis]|uniref:hypothetical protein n=1 Tax=Pseudonocardia xinjiangensis TaxID=75289 RepID=UPI003D8A6DBE
MAVSSPDPEAVARLAGTVLRSSSALHGMYEGGRATYEATARELVLEIDISDTDAVPNEQGRKYVAVRRSRQAGEAARRGYR